VVGQLVFGYLSDRWSRTDSLVMSTVILVIFTALASGSYWHGEAKGMFDMLAAWRFFVSAPASCKYRWLGY
jgi:MFS family permease